MKVYSFVSAIFIYFTQAFSELRFLKFSVMPMDRAFRGVVNPPPQLYKPSKKYQSVYFTYCNYSYYN